MVRLKQMCRHEDEKRSVDSHLIASYWTFSSSKQAKANHHLPSNSVSRYSVDVLEKHLSPSISASNFEKHL